ncbi:hypothetical protein [Paenibacillus sp. Mc5Re-14]|uniref:hypothetical protein n=1 Tax=Paenibacillus sp. Mc5Re-14 TaxID=1030529 RepID=UPI000AAA07A4|nr:hypothetical protein [Paenibacillus sp. Mc5Re-14]
MERIEFLKGVIEGMTKNCIKSLPIKQNDLEPVKSIIADKEDRDSFIITDNHGRLTLKYENKKNNRMTLFSE